ncbi:hypothetical protein L209DRAFT_559611 [Thermothelomyces heterothallicus CBS 203.75]
MEMEGFEHVRPPSRGPVHTHFHLFISPCLADEAERNPGAATCGHSLGWKFHVLHAALRLRYTMFFCTLFCFVLFCIVWVFIHLFPYFPYSVVSCCRIPRVGIFVWYLAASSSKQIEVACLSTETGSTTDVRYGLVIRHAQAEPPLVTTRRLFFSSVSLASSQYGKSCRRGIQPWGVLQPKNSRLR